jgi:putative phosphoesterase
MIRIGVLSDTHLTVPTDDFERNVNLAFRDVNIIFHAGDITTKEVLDSLARWDVRAVQGNMDEFNLKSVLPDKRVEEVEGKRIGIIHGWGGPYGIEELVMKEFRDVDAIVFGHSHIPLNIVKKGVPLFNPGSFRGRYAHPGTMGIIDVDDGEMRFSHVTVI